MGFLADICTVLDTFKHKGLRRKLVESLAEKGIEDAAVLEAIGKVPRHIFVETVFEPAAYEDKALPIPDGQTISQPFTVAYQSALLDLKPKMKVLEIGTGSGYQCAVLCAMGMRVFSVELSSKLHQMAKSRIEDLQYTATLLCGDGSQGWPLYQPYQRILVTAASPNVPEPLKRQLEIGGKLVIPVGDRDVQIMTRVTRLSQDEFKVERFKQFVFVPLTGRYGWRED